ncbi:YhfH family protein [Brevibacillus sp. SYP-B805]|uniref:protein YhfH n=1 Tax=Brevibacillus sp. SYP-B805 TaxID=1578199 RepID=UPI0013EE2A04|nr:protein YhfH [Brevibacillus sp. SYP-B805]NGQ96684.1 YhfH family protein [Brevibacillus sp. SYP-B805]
MTPVTTFFKNLEARRCLICGSVLMEEGESYLTECFPCQGWMVNQEEREHQ